MVDDSVCVGVREIVLLWDCVVDVVPDREDVTEAVGLDDGDWVRVGVSERLSLCDGERDAVGVLVIDPVIVVEEDCVGLKVEV